MFDRFEIISLAPIAGTNLWISQVAIRTTETIGDHNVGHEALLKVRVEFGHSGTAADLLEIVLNRAEQLLKQAGSVIDEKTAAQLMQEVADEQ